MTTPGNKKCPLCGEEIFIDAVLCPHCGQIPGLSATAPEEQQVRSGARTAGSRRSPASGVALSVWGVVMLAHSLG